jgi:hypothetical protein
MKREKKLKNDFLMKDSGGARFAKNTKTAQRFL